MARRLIINGQLELENMTSRVKYPRTLHLPWSAGVQSDDKIGDIPYRDDEWVIVTEKMDGENTTIYPDGYTHARSIDSKYHPSRTYVKQLAARLRGMPYRVCGENCYAEHSVPYTELEDYFLAFSVWDEDRCLSWSETVEFCEEWDIKMVPVIAEGFWGDIKKNLQIDPETQEGYVVRPLVEFSLPSFPLRKYVREGHVQTGKHWMHQEVTPNKLR